jgi:soluble P-type ATPase
LQVKNEIIQKLQGEYDELVSIGNNTEDLREI